MKQNNKLPKRLNSTLSNYTDTIELIDKLIKERTNAQEIILLACTRLDSLANLNKKAKKTDSNEKNNDSQKSAFKRFLTDYSGDKSFFNQISVGDLYSYIKFHGYISNGGLIEVPGRIRRFGKESDDFLRFIEKSTVPITQKSVVQLSNRITKLLEQNFRVKPRQKRTKSYFATETEIKNLIGQEFKEPAPDIIKEAFENLLERFKIKTILYEKYRCDIVHGLKIDVNETDFFGNTSPFHGIYENTIGEYFNIVFPAQYLNNLLERTLTNYNNKLVHTKKLPSELFFKIFSSEEIINENVLQFLDESTLEEFQDIRWQYR